MRNFFVGITPTQNDRHGVKVFIQTWCEQHRDKWPKDGFLFAHTELAASGISLRPNLIEEIVVTQTLENEGCSDGRLSLTACVRDGDALLRLVGTVDANGGALGTGF